MPYITTSDGTEIYYTEQGSGQPIIFSHGWPLNSDAWALELKLFADAGYRAIAHDRRGHGRSSKTYQGNDLDHYAKDLSDLIEALDLHDVIVVGHSTGGGEVIRYVAQHGAGRVAKAVTVGAIPPLMLKTEANPGGAPIEVFDALRAGVLGDRSQFFKDLAVPFFGGNREGSKASQGLYDEFWREGMEMNVAAAYDCIEAFSNTDQTADLKAIEVPVLLLHGDDDQIVPIDAASRTAVTLLKNGTLKVYPGAPHGIFGENQKQIDQDILDFIAD
ncbi:alpha/beta hydrolase [Leifsonia sp. NPDC077715]|uniref:alpha/beta fold hydrolase n=1 Tax=Leifsonia sp. NPDC077715 TaxID=3155539 RepID=UPI003428B36D